MNDKCEWFYRERGMLVRCEDDAEFVMHIEQDGSIEARATCAGHLELSKIDEQLEIKRVKPL